MHTHSQWTLIDLHTHKWTSTDLHTHKGTSTNAHLHAFVEFKALMWNPKLNMWSNGLANAQMDFNGLNLHT